MHILSINSYGSLFCRSDQPPPAKRPKLGEVNMYLNTPLIIRTDFEAPRGALEIELFIS